MRYSQENQNVIPEVSLDAALPDNKDLSAATILINKNIVVPMRDGVKLAADAYRLDGTAPTPLLVARTPYNKDDILANGVILTF